MSTCSGSESVLGPVSRLNGTLVKSRAPGTTTGDNTKYETGHSSQPRSNTPQPYKWDIKWFNVVAFSAMHVFLVYAIYITVCGRVQVKTLLYLVLLYVYNALGMTAGVHRLWSHRSYKATLPLRAFLMVAQTMAYQYNIFKWVRDHRVHHKYSDTDADPHNRARGFFFAHIGWLLVHRHPELTARLYEVDMTDVMADPLLAWQRWNYPWFGPLVAFVLPPLIPYYFWSEPLLYSFAVATVLRYSVVLHFTFLVNSAAHTWGNQPYDKNLTSMENMTVALCAFGEGWHNFHHAFPTDYKTSELGNYRLNFTTAFIDACAFLGLASDLKTVTDEQIKRRIQTTGDVTAANGGAVDSPKAVL